MCARRFLIIVFVLTLLAVAAAFAIFRFGDRVLVRNAVPKGEFQAPPPQSGPDYAALESWIAHPELPPASNPALWMPGSAEPVQPQTTNSSIFYIHPTTYLQRDRWNAPLSGSPDADARADLFVKTQASAFSAAGKIWVPRYRQAAFGAFLLRSEDAQKALSLAYGDVLAAFDRFIAAIPPDEPIILAGHSQGALHLTRLLVDRSAQIRDRLVAAYVVGWPVSTTADLPAMRLPPCGVPDQTGCVLSWMSFGEPANADLVLEPWQESRGPAGSERRREDMLCVNPITGTLNGAAPPALNPGTLVPTPDLTDARLSPGLVGGRCSDGLLMIDGAIPTLGPFVLPGNNYHVYDYALFWGAIRRDAERRAAAWTR